MKRKYRVEFWLSRSGLVFDKRLYTNIEAAKHGYLPLPNDYPYTMIFLPVIRSQEEIDNWRKNLFLNKKKLKDYEKGNKNDESNNSNSTGGNEDSK